MIKEKSPWIKTVLLDRPSLQDNTADADRLVVALKRQITTDHIEIDLELLRRLPSILRAESFAVRCILFKNRQKWTLTGITGVEDSHPVAGLAVDLGTSRVVVRLLDLSTGKALMESAFDNPQLKVGPDILARIHYATEENGLTHLTNLILDGLNQSIEAICRACKIESNDIYAMTVAGNTAMTHLFLGLNPYWIIREPYIPVVNSPSILKAGEMGIRVNPSARLLVFPNIGSYFGGDLIAGIFYSGLHQMPETAILVDVGTNAEVVVGNENWLIACAGAAGPALEGGVTKMGMMAGPGVVDRIKVDPESHEFEIHTIDNQPARGICGSGVIDLAAQLFLAGMIDIRGKFVPSKCGTRLEEKDGQMVLTVVAECRSATGSNLTISQADLDSLIRSKAAMYTILETITGSVGLSFTDLDAFYVAGTFGSFIDPVAAIAIGMMPDLPLESYRPLGNSSLEGAAMALMTDDCLEAIDSIRNRITYLELNVNQDFMNRFSAARFLPHTNPALFPSVKV